MISWFIKAAASTTDLFFLLVARNCQKEKINRLKLAAIYDFIKAFPMIHRIYDEAGDSKVYCNGRRTARG